MTRIGGSRLLRGGILFVVAGVLGGIGGCAYDALHGEAGAFQPGITPFGFLAAVTFVPLGTWRLARARATRVHRSRRSPPGIRS